MIKTFLIRCILLLKKRGVFRTLRGADPEHNVGLIHGSNPDHLLVFKTPCGDNARVQSGTPPFLRLHVGTIY